jgi:hypothetical protein
VRRTLAEGTNEAEVDRTADGLLTLLGYEPPGAVDPAVTVREDAARALGRLRWPRRTARRPLVLKISDLHFADDVGARPARRGVRARAPPPGGGGGHGPARPCSTGGAPRAGRHNTLALHLDPLDRRPPPASCWRC